MLRLAAEYVTKTDIRGFGSYTVETTSPIPVKGFWGISALLEVKLLKLRHLFLLKVFGGISVVLEVRRFVLVLLGGSKIRHF